MPLVADLALLLVLVALGYAGGELVARAGLPRVLGYILVGMVISPYAIGLIDETLPDSSLVKLLIAIGLGFVGFSIGAGIHVRQLKSAGAKIVTIGLFASYVPFLLVALAMYFLLRFDAITSLVIGSIALATAPIVALSIVQEYRTEGPVTRALMPIIALDDILAFLTFGLVIGFADAYYSGTQASLIEPFAEVFLSIGLGLVVGLASYYILRGIHNKGALAIGTTLLLMMTMVLSLVLHAEMLIAGITWGVVVFNLLNESQQKRFSHANERLVQVSVVVLMVLIGTTLDLKAVLSFAVIVGATVYVLARGIGKVGGSAIGAKLANAEPTVQKYLGVTLLAAAGITLTFVAIASSVLPESSATRMATTIAAAALINEVIAVVATKWAFKQAGELGKLDEVVV